MFRPAEKRNPQEWVDYISIQYLSNFRWKNVFVKCTGQQLEFWWFNQNRKKDGEKIPITKLNRLPYAYEQEQLIRYWFKNWDELLTKTFGVKKKKKR